MKARLLQYDETFQLLLCTGKIKTLSQTEACEFILNYANEAYYAGTSTWDYEDLTMESYQGDTIATVDDDGNLKIFNPDIYKRIMNSREITFLTAQEYADKYGKQPAIIRRFCYSNRIPGAILKGRLWLIPEDAPYPPDERMR